MNTLSTNSIKEIIKSWKEMQNFLSMFSKAHTKFPIYVRGLHGLLQTFFISLVLETKKNMYSLEVAKESNDAIIVVSSEQEALQYKLDIKAVMPEAKVYIIPSWQTIPYRALAPSSSTFQDRAAGLSLLCSGEEKNQKRIFILHENLLLQNLPEPKTLKQNTFRLNVGQKLDTIEVAKKLNSIGYTRVPRVHIKGEFSLRGEVLDLFIPSEENPYRIVFDFDQIGKIKTFDPESQVTIESFKSVLVVPLKEFFWSDKKIEKLKNKIEEYEKNTASTLSSKNDFSLTEDNLSELNLPFTEKAKEKLAQMIYLLEQKGECEGEELLYPLVFEPCTLSDYIAKETNVFFLNYDRIINAELNVRKEYELLYRKARLEFPALPPKKMLIPLKTTLESLLRCILFKTVLSSEVEKSTENNENLVSDFSFSAGTAHFYFGNIQFFKDEIASLQAESWKIVIFANGENQARRIEEVTKNIQSSEEESKDRGKAKNAKSSKLDGDISIIPSEISEGFTLHEKKLLVIQENEIFGRKKHISKSFKKAKSSVIDTFVELNPGDYCVHVQYGIAKFLGIERVKAAGSERDYIKLEYANSEFVFVPIEQLDMVQRYIGGDGENPKLDTIGSKAWENRKNKVKQSVEDIAKKLIDLYSRRKLAKGFPFPKDSEYQAMFEASFPYEDTDDQVAVTAEVKADMEKDIPMDRLICGDVGYGKTEIALRAAFKACMGGKQVAFLAPTTILAQQHYETALERFSHFPIKIGLLSRFVSKQNQKKTLDLILKGNIDIIIGTHRIIQKDVVFKNLGLMIIDEEQRFGVKDKDKLKEIKTNIDCLSLSATPIPRTLHMSLLKIRDMSLLTTPPQNRQAIETIIDEYSEERVASAIRNEVSREGQVFYLHNRVETLLEVKQKLEHIVPEFLIEVAHGKMTSNELDDIFHRFKNAAFHVLISTTIIENGIDIPNVNTIIIDRADMYGVSQLYQLRGRVGRSDRKAYAYLLHPKGKALSEVAMKRLQVISDFTELGSGFKIAMKDMEIRGAGNLLGKDQSGNVYAVGFDLYLRLLSECIERLMAQKDYKEDSDVVLELEYSAFIPDSYIQNTQVKMEVYKKIASIQSEDDLYSVTTELIDRFGDFGEEITSLLSLAEIRILCKKLNISSLKEKNGIVVVEFSRVADISVEKIVKLISESGGRVLLDSNRANVILLKTGKIGLKEKSSFIYENLHKIA